MAIVQEVYDEVADPMLASPAALTKASVMKSALAASKVHVRPLLLGSSEGALYGLLRQGRTTANDAGEIASVALASEHSALCFVTADKGAAWLAWRELGTRSRSMSWFLRSLVESGALPISAASAIQGSDKVPPPAWWAGWVRSSSANG